MNPFANDLVNNWDRLTLFAPAARAATANGTGVDCSAYEGPLYAAVDYGVLTDGQYLFSLEESNDDSSYSPITPLVGSFSTITTSTGKQEVGFKRTKKYVRGVITETSAGSTGLVCAMTLMGRKKAV